MPELKRDQASYTQSNPTQQPPPGYTPRQPPVFVQPTLVNSVLIFGKTPQRCICPHCRKDILTKVEYETSVGTYIISGLICFFGLFCLFCLCGLIPFCIDDCKDANHFCPNCNQLLGTKKLIS